MFSRSPYLLEFSLTVGAADGKLGFRYSGNTVICLTPSGWAKRSGVQIDDRLLQVNGKDFSSLSEDDQFVLLTGPRPLSLKFGRPKITHQYFEVECADTALGFMLNDDCSIKTIVAGGWAEKNSLQVGDKIVECNGFVFEELSEGAKIQLLLQGVKGPKPLYLLVSRENRGETDEQKAERKRQAKASMLGTDGTAGNEGGWCYCCAGTKAAPERI